MEIIDATFQRDFVFGPKANGTSGAITYHFHDAYELLYLISGNLQFFIADRLYSVSPENAILIPKHTIHKSQNRASIYERIVWNFTDTFLDSSILPHLNHLCEHPVYQPNADYMHDMIRKFKTEQYREAQGDPFAADCSRHYLNLMLAHFIRNETQYTISGSSLANPTIDRIVHFINEHYGEPLRLRDIAKMLNLSPNYLSRIFVETTGFRFKEYLTGIHVQNARRLLEDTDLPIHVVAERCGFEDSNYFSSAFKTVVGLSPQTPQKAGLLIRNPAHF